MVLRARRQNISGLSVARGFVDKGLLVFNCVDRCGLLQAGGGYTAWLCGDKSCLYFPLLTDNAHQPSCAKTKRSQTTWLAKCKVKLMSPEPGGSHSNLMEPPERWTRGSSAGHGREAVTTTRLETTEITQEQKCFHSTQIALKWGT